MATHREETEIILLDHQPSPGYNGLRQTRQPNTGISKVLEHRTAMDNVISAHLQWVRHQIVAAHLDIRRKVREEPNVDVSRDHRPRPADSLRKPARN